MLNTKTIDALELLLYIAVYGKGRAIRSAEISKYNGKAVRYYEPLLQLLVQHEVLKGTRGPKGGYSLATEKRKISVADIVQIIHTPDPSLSQTAIGQVILEEVTTRINAHSEALLHAITLETLCERLENKENSTVRPDFTI